MERNKKGKFISQNKKITRKCLVCGENFTYYESTHKRKYCSLACYHKSLKGKKRPEHSKIMTGKKSLLKGKKRPIKYRLSVSGKNSKNWKGGKTTIYHKIRRLPEFDVWRLSVYKRDLFTCQRCKKSGIRLECHHIKSFAQIIKDNSIKTINNALNCKELWNINNGITYCKDCHKLTDSYGKNIN